MNTANYIGAILIFAGIIAGLFFYLRWRKDKNSARRVDAVYANTSVEVPRDFAFTYTTPLGVMIGSVEQIPSEHRHNVFTDIDDAFQTFLRSTEHLGWANGRKPSEVGLIFLKPQATNQDGTPALVTRAKYGSIQNAGTVIGINDGFPYVAVVLPANFGGRNRQYTKDAFRFELEHAGAFQNDIALFNRYVGENDQHPIFPDPQGVKGLTAARTIQNGCGLRTTEKG